MRVECAKAFLPGKPFERPTSIAPSSRLSVDRLPEVIRARGFPLRLQSHVTPRSVIAIIIAVAVRAATSVEIVPVDGDDRSNYVKHLSIVSERL